MKTLLILLTSIFFSIQVPAQEIAELIKEGEFVWDPPKELSITPEKFDNDEYLDGELTMTVVRFTPGKESTPQILFDMIVESGSRPMNLKQGLQWLSTNLPGTHPSKQVVFLGSHVHMSGLEYYPTVTWVNGVRHIGFTHRIFGEGVSYPVYSKK